MATTRNATTHGMLAFLEHPEQWEIFKRDRPKTAVDEIIRWATPVTSFQRTALEDTELGGQTIREGEGILVVNETANRDPAVFADPDRLDLRRDARHQASFGYGPHACAGQPLARMELQVVYPTLLRRIPTLALATGLDEIPFKHDGFVYGVYELPVRW